MSLEHIAVGDVRLAVRRWASHQPSTRPMVVLLPALGETSADWREIATELSQDRDVLAVDLRGHGDSDWPGAYSLHLMASDVRALLGVLDQPVDMVGHSLGGLVAWRVAASDSNQVRRLVLEDVALLRPRRPDTPARPDGPLRFDWAVVEQVRPEIDHPDSDWPTRAARLTCATLVIGGGRTSFVPQEHVADLARTIPSARLATIDAGHLVHANSSQEYLTLVRDFLDT